MLRRLFRLASFISLILLLCLLFFCIFSFWGSVVFNVTRITLHTRLPNGAYNHYAHHHRGVTLARGGLLFHNAVDVTAHAATRVPPDDSRLTLERPMSFADLRRRMERLAPFHRLGFTGLQLNTYRQNPGGGRGDTLLVSMWFLLALTAILPAARIAPAFLRTMSLRRRRLAKGLCPRCAYDLRATPDKCPECGYTSSSSQPEHRDAPAPG